jgi:hypothetical protein
MDPRGHLQSALELAFFTFNVTEPNFKTRGEEHGMGAVDVLGQK